MVDDPDLKRKFGELFRKCRELEHQEFAAGRKASPAPGTDPAKPAESLRRVIRSGNYMADHFDEIPLLIFVFAIDDHGGANIYPAIWSAFLAARGEGVGGVMTTAMRYVEDTVYELLGVPVERGWRMSAMLAFGYPLGRWGVAADRHPVHEVSSRNRWGAPLGVEVPLPLWPDPAEPQNRLLTWLTFGSQARRPSRPGTPRPSRRLRCDRPDGPR